MGVLNFAHGAFILRSAPVTESKLDAIGSSPLRFLVAAAIGLLCGAILGALVEWHPDPPLYQRPSRTPRERQAGRIRADRARAGDLGPDRADLPDTEVDVRDDEHPRARTIRFVEIAAAVVTLGGLIAFLRYTRYGSDHPGRGREPRDGHRTRNRREEGVHAGLRNRHVAARRSRGAALGVYFGSVDPRQGTSLLIFAFIVTVIGGLGSITGSAVAVAVGLIQQYANYYASSGTGDLAVVLLLALTLLVKPGGLAPKVAH